jgi:tRNA (guanine37-N1)-methyltransferase
MKIHIITIFPNILNSYLEESIIKRAINNKIVSINTHNLRNWTSDKHQSVDDTPYGGGAGMLIKVEPIYKAIKEIKSKNIKKDERKIVLLSAGGKKWKQKTAKKYSTLKEIIFICGRYEGVDERVKEFIDEEISIGDYVLTGGELAAMVISDSIVRLLPDSLGNKDSTIDESHSNEGVIEYPQYTRPEVFKINNKKHHVPKILLSGNHKKIEDWKNNKKRQIK